MGSTYKDLYTLVQGELKRNTTYANNTRYSETFSASRLGALSNNANVGAVELVQAIQDTLTASMQPRIVTGLVVTATTPESIYVNISAGTGAVGGTYYILEEAVTLEVPFRMGISVYYINLYQDYVVLEGSGDVRKLTIAKIIVPATGNTPAVYDKRQDANTPYIQNQQVFTLYHDGNGKLEEDSIDFLRENIGELLADNLIGNLRLSENLKITNTHGSIELDSAGLKILNPTKNILAKFNKSGVHFYNAHGTELSRFTDTDAMIGNILITVNSLESQNFATGISGFKIKDNGDAEFNGVTVRGQIEALTGSIGGFTIASNKLYGGTIQTSANVGVGDNGVQLDSDGLRGYNSLLGNVFNLPTDGTPPSFSGGTINNTIFEINTNSVLRTSETVGDGTSESAGILINTTGLYGCGTNQELPNANLKVLANGDVYLRGQIVAETGSIGGFTIIGSRLSGGLLQGSHIIGSVIENTTTLPRLRLDENGFAYQTIDGDGKYGTSGSGLLGFKYGDDTLYGTGVTAYLFNDRYPTLSVMQERSLADIRMYNRANDPVTGSHEIGDLIVVNGVVKICTTGGAPGVFSEIAGGSNYEAGFGIDITADVISVNYDTNNLKIESGNVLTTIQSITTTSTPEFGGMTLTGDLNLSLNEAKNFVLDKRTSNPTAPVLGQMWLIVEE